MKSSVCRRLIGQFFQYLGVGSIAFVVDFGSLYAMTSIGGLHYIVSATIAFFFGLLTNYHLCVRMVFDHRRIENRLHEFFVFGAIGVLGLLLNNIALYGLTEFAGFHYLTSKVFSAGLILFINFGLRRHILFSMGAPLRSSAMQETSAT